MASRSPRLQPRVPSEVVKVAESAIGLLAHVYLDSVAILKDYGKSMDARLMAQVTAQNIERWAGETGILRIPLDPAVQRPLGTSPFVDERPHSRACEADNHSHGPQCHINCPTCHGEVAGGGWQ